MYSMYPVYSIKKYHLIEDLKLNLVPDIGVISINCVLVWQGTRLLEW